MSVAAPRQRLVFFGAGAFGLPTLEALAEAHDLSLVVTQPDRPAGRGRKPAPNPIGAWAAEAVETGRLAPEQVFKPESVNDPALRDHIRGFEVDAWVVIAFGQKLSRRLLEDRFAINLHASLLPRWRGAAPINAAILAGDAETGNSVITLADRMDAGLVLGQSRPPYPPRRIEPQLTAGALHDLLAADGPALMLDVLQQRAEGRLAPLEQDESLVTVAPKLSKADGWVDFGQPAEAVRRRIHGLTPWPGATVEFRGEPLKLLRAEVVDGFASGLAPGAIAEPEEGVVACAQGELRVLETQPAGGRKMMWSEFARGRRPARGERLHGRTEPAR